jgi:peptidoglycan/LPS O-acetylase OafA/YrhL
MRLTRTSGSVGGLGGRPPRSTRPFSFLPLFLSYHPKWLLLCVAISIAAAYGLFESHRSLAEELLLMPVVIYIMVYVGMLKIPPLPIYRRGDYSYGVYLYGYPILSSNSLSRWPPA